MRQVFTFCFIAIHYLSIPPFVRFLVENVVGHVYYKDHQDAAPKYNNLVSNIFITPIPDHESVSQQLQPAPLVPGAGEQLPRYCQYYLLLLISTQVIA